MHALHMTIYYAIHNKYICLSKKNATINLLAVESLIVNNITKRRNILSV